MPKNTDAFTDTELIRMICGQSHDREKALHYIFVHSGWLKEAINTLQRKGTPSQDAKDAIQEAVIVLDKQIRSGGFEKDKPLKQYFLGICAGRVYSNKRSQKRISESDNMPIVVNPDTPETETLETERKKIIRRLLNQLDDKCRDLLTHYMLSFSMKEIRELMNITSDVMTRKMAYDCRQKLANLIDNSPTIKRYFKN